MSAVREPVAGVGDCAALRGLFPVELLRASILEGEAHAIALCGSHRGNKGISRNRSQINNG